MTMLDFIHIEAVECKCVHRASGRPRVLFATWIPHHCIQMTCGLPGQKLRPTALSEKNCLANGHHSQDHQ